MCFLHAHNVWLYVNSERSFSLFQNFIYIFVLAIFESLSFAHPESSNCFVLCADNNCCVQTKWNESFFFKLTEKRKKRTKQTTTTTERYFFNDSSFVIVAQQAARKNRIDFERELYLTHCIAIIFNVSFVFVVADYFFLCLFCKSRLCCLFSNDRWQCYFIQHFLSLLVLVTQHFVGLALSTKTLLISFNVIFTNLFPILPLAICILSVSRYHFSPRISFQFFFANRRIHVYFVIHFLYKTITLDTLVAPHFFHQAAFQLQLVKLQANKGTKNLLSVNHLWFECEHIIILIFCSLFPFAISGSI